MIAPTQQSVPAPAGAGFNRAAAQDIVALNSGDYVEVFVASSASNTALAVNDCMIAARFLRGL